MSPDVISFPFSRWPWVTLRKGRRCLRRSAPSVTLWKKEAAIWWDLISGGYLDGRRGKLLDTPTLRLTLIKVWTSANLRNIINQPGAYINLDLLIVYLLTLVLPTLSTFRNAQNCMKCGFPQQEFTTFLIRGLKEINLLNLLLVYVGWWDQNQS